KFLQQIGGDPVALAQRRLLSLLNFLLGGRLEALDADLHGAGRAALNLVFAADDEPRDGFAPADRTEEGDPPVRQRISLVRDYPRQVSLAPAAASQQQRGKG